MLLFLCKMIQYLCRVQTPIFMLFIQKLRNCAVYSPGKIIRDDQAADSPVQLFILDHPGQERFLRCQDTVLLWF